MAGRIAEETPYAKLGQHHTLDLELHRNFTLIKEEGGWDSVNIGVIKEACKAGRGASAWAVIMQEGLANVVELVGKRTVLRRRVNQRIPGKRGNSKEHDKVTPCFRHRPDLTDMVFRPGDAEILRPHPIRTPPLP